ncbi:MAG: hypothetical protein BWY09_02376 [Candidatus Hydrogenedentes bacterium ADurb.Bin179]|nr:MAG: hypothetical protein BWY09_02376 [Candidatus Hydrogenedentes bacterium ADurb.Bin179]
MFEGIHDGIHQVRLTRVEFAADQVPSERRRAVIVEDKEDRNALGIHRREPRFPLGQDIGVQGIVDIPAFEGVFVIASIATMTAHHLHVNAVGACARQFTDQRGLIAGARAIGVARAAVQEIFGVARTAHEKRPFVFIGEPCRMQRVHHEGTGRRGRYRNFDRALSGQAPCIRDREPRRVHARGGVRIVRLGSGRVHRAVILKIPFPGKDRAFRVMGTAAVKMHLQRGLAQRWRGINHCHGRICVAGRARLGEQFEVLVHARGGIARHEGACATKGNHQVEAGDDAQRFRAAMPDRGEGVGRGVRPGQHARIGRAIVVEPPIEPVDAGTVGGLIRTAAIGADTEVIAPARGGARQGCGHLGPHIGVEIVLRQELGTVPIASITPEPADTREIAGRCGQPVPVAGRENGAILKLQEPEPRTGCCSGIGAGPKYAVEQRDRIQFYGVVVVRPGSAGRLAPGITAGHVRQVGECHGCVLGDEIPALILDKVIHAAQPTFLYREEQQGAYDGLRRRGPIALRRLVAPGFHKIPLPRDTAHPADVRRNLVEFGRVQAQFRGRFRLPRGARECFFTGGHHPYLPRFRIGTARIVRLHGNGMGLPRLLCARRPALHQAAGIHEEARRAFNQGPRNPRALRKRQLFLVFTPDIGPDGVRHYLLEDRWRHRFHNHQPGFRILSKCIACLYLDGKDAANIARRGCPAADTPVGIHIKPFRPLQEGPVYGRGSLEQV